MKELLRSLDPDERLLIIMFVLMPIGVGLGTLLVLIGYGIARLCGADL